MTVTGLMFYNARYYDPVARNFVSPDTIIPDPASSLGWNRYSYVNNNPINYSDPSGHELVVNGHASACGGSSIPGCEHQNAKREQRTTRAQNKADLFEHEGLEFHEAISAPSVTEVAFNNEVQYHLERFTKNQHDLQASPDMFCNSGLFDPLCGAETAADVIFNVIMQKPSQVLEEQGIRLAVRTRASTTAAPQWSFTDPLELAARCLGDILTCGDNVQAFVSPLVTGALSLAVVSGGVAACATVLGCAVGGWMVPAGAAGFGASFALAEIVWFGDRSEVYSELTPFWEG